jgi:hypothetical protein
MLSERPKIWTDGMNSCRAYHRVRREDVVCTTEKYAHVTFDRMESGVGPDVHLAHDLRPFLGCALERGEEWKVGGHHRTVRTDTGVVI